MPKKSIASLELAALVNELQLFVRGRLTQIYHPDKKMLFLQLYIKDQPKQYLKVVSGKLICLTKEKHATLHPSSFCMQLRKYITNAVIKKIEQRAAERIIIIELEKKQSYYLIVELFSKGNILLTDSSYNTIAALEQQRWKDRIVKAKEKYVFPQPGVNWKKITKNNLFSLLQESQKRSVVIALATELGLGGLYAEELCSRANIDKTIPPQEISKVQASVLLETLQKLLELVIAPQGNIYEEDITPFPLLNKKPQRATETYNEAIATLQIFTKPSPYEQKIALLKKTIANQKEAIINLGEKITDNTRKGELIYEKYSEIQKLLHKIETIQAEKGWQEVAAKLKKNKQVKNLDLKKKILMVDYN